MKTAHEFLNMTAAEYEQYKIELYMRWCINLSAKTRVGLQSIMANSAIANYFRTQYAENEHTFISAASKIAGVLDYQFMRTMLSTIQTDLYNAWPSALLEAAQNLKIENPQIYN